MPHTVRRRKVDLPKLQLRASVAPSTLDEEKRTVDLIWTTGERVLRGFFDNFFEELSLDPKHVRMGRLRNGAPLLDAHASYSNDNVIGVVESARIESGKGIATVRFAKDQRSDEIFAKVKDGIIRNVSVGYRIHKMEKVDVDDEKIPVYRAVDWEPMELSMVPIGADSGAGVRSATAETNPCDVITEEKRHMPKKKGAEPKLELDNNTRGADDDDEERDDAEEERDDDAEDADDEEGEDDGGGERAAGSNASVLAERNRIVAIQRAAETLELPADLAAEHVRKGTSADEFRKIAMRVFGKTRAAITTGHPGTRITAGDDAEDKLRRCGEAWLIQRSGHADIVARREKTAAELDPGEFRGMTLLEIARFMLERRGVKTRGLSKLELVAKAFTHRAGGYQTTSDFPVLLEGTLNRVLLAAYATVPDRWRLFCKKGSVGDFRPHSRIRQGTFGRLDKVNEHGEFKNKPIPDGAAEEIAAETFGNIVAVSRQMIINDDLGAFTDIAQRLGRAAGLSIEADVFALLALNAGLGPTMSDGNTLFHANHGNIGTGAALTVSSLDADMLKMGLQQDLSGNEYLDIRPEILLVHLGQETYANLLIQSPVDVDIGDGVTPNRVRGRIPKIVASPRLASTTRRYYFADPNEVPTIEVVFLDGQEQPFMDQQEGWRIDGTEWKIRLDYGVDAVDWKGAVTNAGA